MARRRAKALRPPPGLYDPQLDAAYDAARRGYADYQADVGRDFGEGYSGGRVGHDYQLGLERLGVTQKRSDEDFARATQGLDRNYMRLGRSQAEGARARGVLSGGLAARAAAIRAGNKAWDLQPITQAHNRATADIGRSRGDLGLNYQRQVEDARTGVFRAGRETEQFGLDTNASRVFSATQQGWDPYAGERDAFAASQARGLSGQQAAVQAALRGARRRPRRRGLIGTVGRVSYGASF